MRSSISSNPFFFNFHSLPFSRSFILSKRPLRNVFPNSNLHISGRFQAEKLSILTFYPHIFCWFYSMNFPFPTFSGKHKLSAALFLPISITNLGLRTPDSAILIHINELLLRREDDKRASCTSRKWKNCRRKLDNEMIPGKVDIFPSSEHDS